MGLAHRCQTVATPANISRICTLWKMWRKLRSAAGGEWCGREVLANHHQKSPQRWVELRLYLKYGSQRASNLGCCRRSRRRKRFVVHADEKLTAFVELEAAVQRRIGLTTGRISAKLGVAKRILNQAEAFRPARFFASSGPAIPQI